MLERILRLYTTAMATGCTSPLPHLFGPPGSGKSHVMGRAADLIGVNLHTINLARVSPLELEGVQMPVTEEEMKLKLLHATFWTQIQEGDIVLFDEFLRAFPEVFNGLLDILTSREVGGLKLPPAFFVAASNSVITYDKALEDRLLHIPVDDPRKLKRERKRIADLLVDNIGLLPSMKETPEMDALIQEEICPMYEMMDTLKTRNAPPNNNGCSVRNLIGQAQLRMVQSKYLQELIDMNNIQVRNDKKWMYLYLLDGKNPPPEYSRATIDTLMNSSKVPPLQKINTELNAELIEFESIRHEVKE
jgi:hypothetical protein